MIQDIHPHQFDNTYHGNRPMNENDYIFYFKEHSLLLKQDGNSVELPRRKDFITSNMQGIFLFTLNGIPCYLTGDYSPPTSAPFIYHEVKYRNPINKDEMDWAGAVAFQLKNWYEQHQFCGKCGNRTELKSDERAIICPSCNNTLYPTISPAIIVAILNEDKILLARGSHFPDGFFSLVAGYVDIGETIEETITREIQEEVGIKVKNVHYYKSQPWPFSASMMLGFIAEAENNQTIKVDGKEILEANWYSRMNLPDHPNDRSIAGEIIEKFMRGDIQAGLCPL